MEATGELGLNIRAILERTVTQSKLHCYDHMNHTWSANFLNFWHVECKSFNAYHRCHAAARSPSPKPTCLGGKDNQTKHDKTRRANHNNTEALCFFCPVASCIEPWNVRHC